MTPNFALSLSFDGIRLLHQVPGGWHLVGEAALDTDDLTAELAVLRKTAIALDPAGLRTKLLIPNEQIKYLSIDSTFTTLDDVHAALDGATPYEIDELAIDFDRTGGRTHIAAVARETLEEAEAFAIEHAFAPLTFAAIAPPFTFSTEVFFGPTKNAPSLVDDLASLVRDAEPVTVIGAASLPEKPMPQTSAPVVEETEPEEEEDAPEVVFASKARPVSADAAEPMMLGNPIATPKTEASQEPPAENAEPIFARRSTAELAAPPVAVASAKATLAAERPQQAAPQPGSFRSGLGAPQRGKPRFLGLMLTVGLLVVLILVALWANTLSDEGLAGWFRGEDEVTTEVAAPALTEASPTATEVAPELAAAQDSEPTVEAAEPVDDVEAIDPQEQAAPLPAQTSPNGTLPILRAAVGRVLSPAEADRIYAVTGVYQRAPRFPLSPRDSSLEGMRRAQIVVANPKMQPLSLPDQQDMLPDHVLSPQPNPPLPGTVFQRDLRGFILAMPDGTVTPDGVLIFGGRPPLEPPLRPGTQIVEPTPDPDAPATNTSPGLRLVAGQPPITPPLRPTDARIEAEIVDDSPTPPISDDAALPIAEVAAAIRSQELATPLVAAPSDSSLEPEVDPVGETQDVALAPLGTPEDAPAVLVTTEAPDATPIADTSSVAGGLRIVTGRPAIVPPLRPAAFSTLTAPAPTVSPDVVEATPTEISLTDDEDVEATVTAVVVNPTGMQTPSGAELASFRPPNRPKGSAPLPPVDLLASADPALSGFRPLVRPDNIAPVPTDTAAVTAALEAAASNNIDTVIANLTDAAVANPVSALAVPRSLRPDARPRNFATVVARAQQAVSPRTSTTSTPTNAVRSAPVTPSGPVPGGVARAATVENAIRLRDLNLIGVYGRSGDRRALVRLSNGRYVKVEVGSSLDGGRVTAIGDAALNYVKRGQTYALQLPAS